jgi:F0F1-type ATP synthase membrane subunit a
MMIGANMLAAANPIHHILDVTWVIGGRTVPWMSSQIAVMILAALLLAIGLPWATRRRVAGGGHTVGLAELLITFVRENIARVTLGDGADKGLPFLATLFVFLLTCNLLSLVPLMDISTALGLKAWGGEVDGRPRFSTPIGGTPASAFWVCAALATLTFVLVLLSGYWRQFNLLRKGRPAGGHGGHGAHTSRGLEYDLNIWHSAAVYLRGRRWPAPVAAVAALWTWLDSFVPALPGIVGLLMWPLLLVLEFMGYVTRCFALAVRLVANMNGGHILLAVLIGFAQSARGSGILITALPAGLGTVALMLLELLVAVVQAYIFTFLSGLFIGLAVMEH